MEKENIEQGVESDGNVGGKDKMLDKKSSELIDENMQQRAELIRRNKEKSETIERLLSQESSGSHKDANDHTITRQNKPQFSRSKSKGPSFLGLWRTISRGHPAAETMDRKALKTWFETD
ncbi:unnamed protein product [Malus baccata var. baccata]